MLHCATVGVVLQYHQREKVFSEDKKTRHQSAYCHYRLLRHLSRNLGGKREGNFSGSKGCLVPWSHSILIGGDCLSASGYPLQFLITHPVLYTRSSLLRDFRYYPYPISGSPLFVCYAVSGLLFDCLPAAGTFSKV